MRARTRALLVLAALGAVSLVYACTLTDVTSVPVGQVSITTASGAPVVQVSILEGATLQLRAEAKDQLGNDLPIGSLEWSVQDPAILSISSAGLAQALQAGQTQVRATLQGVTGSATVTVEPGPTITVGPSSIEFVGAVGPIAPNPVAVQITNSGGGTLVGLSASVDYAQGGPSNWLSLGLVGTTAPTSLTVSVLPVGLQAGTYNATISLSSPAARNSPTTPGAD